MSEQGLFEALFIAVIGTLVAIVVVFIIVGRLLVLLRKDVRATKPDNIFEWKSRS